MVVGQQDALDRLDPLRRRAEEQSPALLLERIACRRAWRTPDSFDDRFPGRRPGLDEGTAAQREGNEPSTQESSQRNHLPPDY